MQYVNIIYEIILRFMEINVLCFIPVLTFMAVIMLRFPFGPLDSVCGTAHPPAKQGIIIGHEELLWIDL